MWLVGWVPGGVSPCEPTTPPDIKERLDYYGTSFGTCFSALTILFQGGEPCVLWVTRCPRWPQPPPLYRESFVSIIGRRDVGHK